MAIKITINGKPAITKKVKNELERSVLDAIIDEVRKKIRSRTSFDRIAANHPSRDWKRPRESCFRPRGA